MKLYVVKCFMEGCEECGDEYHIVGVFSTFEKAKQAKDLHNEYKHLHWCLISIDEVTLDEYIKSYKEGEFGFIKEESGGDVR